MPVDALAYSNSLKDILALYGCRIVNGLEVGLGWGVSAYTFLKAYPEAKLYSVDVLPNLPAKEKLEYEFPHRFKFMTDTEGLWADNTFDYIYLDGSHEVVALSQDIDYYYPKLKSGGLMVFDDYGNKNTPGVGVAVDLFLKDIGVTGYYREDSPTGHLYFVKP